MEDLSGRQFGQYQIVDQLGKGGMASVFKAYHANMDRHVALKVLPLEYARDETYLDRFRQEAKVIANLEHPSILPVYDYGETDGYTYLVMRYVDGGTLGDLLQGKPLLPNQVNAAVSQIGAALDYAHSRGVVHRDVKPSNVLVDQNGNYLLTDFGIAKMVEGTAQFTMTGSFVGTPHYASPEQGLGKELDGRSDIYSLGVIMYEMVTGRQPFIGDTPMAVMYMHVHEDLPPPRSINPAVPDQVEKVIEKALAKDLADRYPNAGEMVHDLDLAQSSAAETLIENTQIENDETMLESTLLVGAQESLQNPSTTVIGEKDSQGTPVPQSRRVPVRLLVGGGILGLMILCAVVVFSSGVLSLFGSDPANQNALETSSAEVAAVLVTEDIALETLSATPTRIFPTPIPPIGSDNIYVEYILDASGSMLEALQGKTKLLIAQEVLSERVAVLPPDVHVGLRVYGHRVPFQQESASCEDIELVVPVAAGSSDQILTWLPSMQAQGMTPISDSIRQAAEDFTFDSERKNSIILISDGIETCGSDPSDVARFLQELGIDFTIHVIGLDVDEQARAQLSRLADTAGGIYHDANSEEDLKSALDELNTVAVQPPAPEPPTPTVVPTAAAIPEANFDATREGIVTASSTYSGFPAGLAVDGSNGTSWFSAGSAVDGATSVYTWTGDQEDQITSLRVISNRANNEPSFREGFGFDRLNVQIIDATGTVVYEEGVSLAGTPDPDVFLQPGVSGRTVVLYFSGHESPDCGGFGELIVGVTR